MFEISRSLARWSARASLRALVRAGARVSAPSRLESLARAAKFQEIMVKCYFHFDMKHKVVVVDKNLSVAF